MQYKNIATQGLWQNNPALVQLLGLCPLLAITNTAINGLALGLATTLVLAGTNTTVSLTRRMIAPEIRLPAFVIIIACFVTALELTTHAFFYGLYLSLGIFLALITTNCAIIGRAEAFASKNACLPAFFDGVMHGIGFTIVLVLLGGMRELLGTGKILTDANLLFGERASSWSITLFSNYPDFLFALLPPGAFIALGLLLALKNWIDSKMQQRASVAKQQTTSSTTNTSSTPA